MPQVNIAAVKTEIPMPEHGVHKRYKHAQN